MVFRCFSKTWERPLKGFQNSFEFFGMALEYVIMRYPSATSSSIMTAKPPIIPSVGANEPSALPS